MNTEKSIASRPALECASRPVTKKSPLTEFLIANLISLDKYHARKPIAQTKPVWSVRWMNKGTPQIGEQLKVVIKLKKTKFTHVTWNRQAHFMHLRIVCSVILEVDALTNGMVNK